MHSARSQSASLFGLTLNNLVRVVSGTPGLGRPHPLGSQKVMGSFAGCAVSGGTFEIVRLFFQRRFFLRLLQFHGLLFAGLHLFFHVWGPRTVLLAHYAQLFLYFKTSWMSLFFVAALSTLLDTTRLFLLWLTRSGFFRCPKKTSDGWRSLIMLSTPEDIVLDVDTESPT